MSIVLLLASVVCLVVAAFVLKAGELRQLRSGLVTYQLHFPRQLDADAVTGFLGGLTGMLLPWWRRWLTTPFVVSEVQADEGGITHLLSVPSAWAATIENLLQAHTPSARYQVVDCNPMAVRIAAEYRLSSGRRMLRVDAGTLSVRLLTSLQPLREGEGIVVQWIVTPSAPVQPPQVASGAESPFSLLRASNVVASSEEAAALREKQAQPLLLGAVRIGVTAGSAARARRLLRQVETSWHSTRAPGVHLRQRGLGEGQVARRLNQRAVPLMAWPTIFNSQELAGLLGWPVGVAQVAGLALSGSRVLAPSPLLPSSGTVIGRSNFPGTERPVALEVDGRLRHVHVLGPTGTGKSTLLLNLIVQDLSAGHGVVVIDPKGDLVRDVLTRVPEDRRDDVMVLDPADDERPVGLNPLRSVGGAHAEVVVENLVGLFKSLYRSSWGPRTDDILRASLLTLAGSGRATLCEVPLLLTDAAYRRRLIARIDDPIGLESFWGWYEGLSRTEMLNVVGPVLNKVRAFTMRTRVRAIVGQAEPALSMPEVLDGGQVLLVSLASGLLGEEAAALFGALVFAELWHATTARSKHQADTRRPVMAHLDEWQHFLHLPTPMAAVLAEARGLGLGLTLAHQHLGQLPNDLRDAVLANSRSRMVFQTAAKDARLLAGELGSGLTADDLQGLRAFEVVAQLFAGGRSQPPVTVLAQPAPAPSNDGAQVRERSRQRWGVARTEVEAAIRARQQGRAPEAPVGRRRRAGGTS